MGDRYRTSPVSVLSLHARGEASVEAQSYPGRSPVLLFALAGTQIVLGTADVDRVSASDVVFARLLAEQAAAFAASCERMYRGLPSTEQQRHS
jgi:hypothetical protein